jgi:serine/threonine protein kinase
MCYLNEKKIMHRDIKPDNIKYFKGKCTLIDFGFACEFNDKLKMKESVGTPSYMSPELLQHQTYNEMSDIWSLGITLY